MLHDVLVVHVEMVVLHRIVVILGTQDEWSRLCSLYYLWREVNSTLSMFSREALELVHLVLLSYF